MIKVVVFDADGVLIFPWRFAQYLAQEHGITREMTAPFFRGIFDQCLLGRADLKAALPLFLEQWNWSGTVDEFVTSWLEIEDAVDGRVVEVVRQLQAAGLTCCLGTSQERYRAEYMRRTMGLAELFDALFFSCEMGCAKPEHVFFQQVAQSLKLPGEQILFWDDSAANVAAARECGWHAELYTDFQDFSDKLASYLA